MYIEQLRVIIWRLERCLVVFIRLFCLDHWPNFEKVSRSIYILYLSLKLSRDCTRFHWINTHFIIELYQLMGFHATLRQEKVRQNSVLNEWGFPRRQACFPGPAPGTFFGAVPWKFSSKLSLKELGHVILRYFALFWTRTKLNLGNPKVVVYQERKTPKR